MTTKTRPDAIDSVMDYISESDGAVSESVSALLVGAIANSNRFVADGNAWHPDIPAHVVNDLIRINPHCYLGTWEGPVTPPTLLYVWRSGGHISPSTSSLYYDDQSRFDHVQMYRFIANRMKETGFNPFAYWLRGRDSPTLSWGIAAMWYMS